MIHKSHKISLVIFLALSNELCRLGNAQKGCVDEAPKCPGHAKDGLCTGAYPNVMRYCRLSCELCSEAPTTVLASSADPTTSIVARINVSTTVKPSQHSSIIAATTSIILRINVSTTVKPSQHSSIIAATTSSVGWTHVPSGAADLVPISIFSSSLGTIVLWFIVHALYT